MSRFEQSTLWQNSLAIKPDEDIHFKERALLRAEYGKFRKKATSVASERSYSITCIMPLLRLCLTALFFLNSHCFCIGQLSNDTLKKICIAYYSTDSDVCYTKNRYPLHYESSYELFKNHFDSTRIFLIVYHADRLTDDAYNFFPKLYAVHTNGEIIRFPNEQSYFDFVNHSKRKVSTLDKSYLYLLLFLRVMQKKQANITFPGWYCEKLRKNSEFVKNKNAEIMSWWDRLGGNHGAIKSTLTPLQMSKYLDSSNSININMFSFEDMQYILNRYPSDVNNITYLYSFNFDQKYNLLKVKIDTLR